MTRTGRVSILFGLKMEVTESSGKGDIMYIQVIYENSKRTFPSEICLSNPSFKMLANGKKNTS